ncbi:MAG: hypothetical protein K5989_01340 [Lachnospiraceae bacterium]|nr:hypothetical protein [Lachnospiraceae bacterium]
MNVHRLLVLQLIVISVTFCGCSLSSINSAPEIRTEAISQNEVDMDELNTITNQKINDLISNELFVEGSFEERYSLAKELLDSLSAEGYIEDLKYAEDEKIFIFRHKNGLKGGLDLKDYSAAPGGIHMN